jgi:hypothetical protein
VPGFVAGAVTVGAPNTSPGAIGAVVRAGIIPSRFYGTGLIQLFIRRLTREVEISVRRREVHQAYDEVRQLLMRDVRFNNSTSFRN